MLAAIEQAKQAQAGGNFGIGAVVVKNHHVVALAGDRSKNSIDPANHAPVQAISQAAGILGPKQLGDCVVYCTLEFCPICATAVISAKLGGAVFGNTLDEIQKYDVQDSLQYIGRTLDISAIEIIGKSPYKIFIVPGFMQEECRVLLEMAI